MKKITLIALVLMIGQQVTAATWQCSDSDGDYDVKVTLDGNRYYMAAISVDFKNENIVSENGRFVKTVRNYGNFDAYGNGPRITNYTFYLGNHEVQNCVLQSVYAETNPNVWSGEQLSSLLDYSRVFLSLRCAGNPIMMNKKLRCNG